VVVEGHRRGHVGADHRPVLAQSVVALDRAVHALLGGHLQHSCLGQQPDVPVHAGLGDVGQARAQVRGRERVPAGHGEHDPQPDRMHEQAERVHPRTIPYLVPFPKLEKDGGQM
jgi:hypothetical protein